MSQQPHSAPSRTFSNIVNQNFIAARQTSAIAYITLCCIAISASFASAQQIEPAPQQLKASKQSSMEARHLNAAESGKQGETGEASEVCRLVLKVEFSNIRNSAASRLRADIAKGVYSDYAISEVRSKRRKASPKISVPVGRNRYRVWYGYSSKIREAVLATAAAQIPTTTKQTSTVAQVSYEEEAKTGRPTAEIKYPHRDSWWTVGKRYPDREAMVKHLSSGQHKGVFALDWLETLTRDELHALHSDDHEKKVAWTYAVKANNISQNSDLNED